MRCSSSLTDGERSGDDGPGIEIESAPDESLTKTAIEGFDALLAAAVGNWAVPTDRSEIAVGSEHGTRNLRVLASDRLSTEFSLKIDSRHAIGLGLEFEDVRAILEFGILGQENPDLQLNAMGLFVGNDRLPADFPELGQNR